MELNTGFFSIVLFQLGFWCGTSCNAVGFQMAMNLAKSSSMRLRVHDMKESNVSAFLDQAQENDQIDAALVSEHTLDEIGRANPAYIVTSLPTCEASEAVVEGLLASLPNDGRSGCTIIDTSTISPNVAKRLHSSVKSFSEQHEYIDAPVSGGVKGAADATLTFMMGCSSSEVFDHVRPLLQKIGKKSILCGGPGSGSAVKLCNNLALAAQMVCRKRVYRMTPAYKTNHVKQVGICEAMNLGDALGVDPTTLANVMNVSTAKSWSCEVNNPHPIAAEGIGSGASANNYEGGFGSALMLKDMNLAVGAGEEEGLALPVAGLTRDLYKMATLHGLGEKDFGVLLQFLRGA